VSCRSSWGRAFHTLGPAEEKLLSPKLLCVRGTTQVLSLALCLCDSYYNAESHSFDTERYSNNEPAYVDQVKMLFDDCGEKKYRVSDVAARSDRLQRVFIMLRVKVACSPSYLLIVVYECS